MWSRLSWPLWSSTKKIYKIKEEGARRSPPPQSLDHSGIVQWRLDQAFGHHPEEANLTPRMSYGGAGRYALSFHSCIRLFLSPFLLAHPLAEYSQSGTYLQH